MQREGGLWASKIFPGRLVQAQEGSEALKAFLLGAARHSFWVAASDRWLSAFWHWVQAWLAAPRLEQAVETAP